MTNTRRHLAILAALGVAAAAACARSVPTSPPGDNTFVNGGNGNGNGGAGGPGNGTPSQDDDASSLLNFPEAGFVNPESDGAPSLAGIGSVGLCKADRPCDVHQCDELQENGQHEYVEQHPDDGSQIPFKDVQTAQGAFNGNPGNGDGPCIVEPPDGALFPNNWVRARIRVKPANSNPTIYRIQIHADRQVNDLIVYTESKTWEIPKDIWTKLAASTWGEPITVKVSAIPAGNGGSPVTSQVKFKIAPALANGQVIYWTTVSSTDDPENSWLESFSVGDENVAVALTVPQAQWRFSKDERGNPSVRGAATTNSIKLPTGSPACVGCHVAVPDRQSLTFIEDWPWDGVASMVDPADVGNLPAWLTPGGAQALSMPWLGMMAFSPHVWNDLSQHIMVSAFQGESTWGMNAPEGGTGGAPFAPWGYQGGNEWDQSPASQLGWIDLSTTAPVVTGANGDQLSLGMAANYGVSWGVIPRIGDPSGVASPTWEHLTGETIVYASTNAARSGREGPSNTAIKGAADLYSVPYNGGMGGSATPVMGASDPAWNEYYPSFSPDDKFIAFNRVPSSDDMYYAPNSEIFVVPKGGGTATRLAANDAPACMNAPSPGITNSWAKWAPEYPNCGGQQYYWLIFSSTREKIPFAGGQGQVQGQHISSQLYLTALTVSETGLTSYPGIFIWNQHTVSAGLPWNNGKPQSNHTPQWEGIDLPPPPPPPPPPTATPPPT